MKKVQYFNAKWCFLRVVFGFCVVTVTASDVLATAGKRQIKYPKLGTYSSIPMKKYTLQQAITQALQHNHDVMLSKLSLEGASAAIIVAHQAPNPFLTVQTAGVNPRLGVGSGSLRSKTVDTTVRIDQLIERGGKRALRTENAIQLEQAAKNDLADSQRQLYLNVTQAYYELLAAQEQVRSSNETVSLFQHTIQAAQQRKKAGDLSGSDVARITIEGLRAENEARQAQTDWVKAQQTLGYLLGEVDTTPSMSVASTNVFEKRQAAENGIKVKEGIQAVDHWPAIEEVPSAEVETVLLRRPDVMAAQKRLEAAQTAASLAQAQKKRDLSVGVQFEHYPISDANSQGSGNSYGFSVQVPLMINTTYEGDIRSALVANEVALESLEKVKSAARLEMRQVLEDEESAAEQVQRFQGALLVAAQQSSEAAEFAFKKGAMGVMDVLDARRVYRATQQESIVAQAKYAKALEAWHAAVRFDSLKEQMQ